MGYHRSGFEVVGVDIAPQPNYPFEFIQADALQYCSDHGVEFDAIHASPPCQGYSTMRFLPWLKGRQYPMLINPVRELLKKTGRPYVIENVVTANIDMDGGVLCGKALGLRISRHRRFESNIMLLFPQCTGHETMFPGSCQMSNRGRRGGVMGIPPDVTPQEATGIDWMTLKEMRQAIPPAYTEFIGNILMSHITNTTPIIAQSGGEE